MRRGDQLLCTALMWSPLLSQLNALYSLEELEKLKDVCKELKLKLHIDGARFSVAAAKLNVDFETIARFSGAAATTWGY